MFDKVVVGGLDADGVLSYVASMRELADRAETQIISAAARYADLHGHLDGPAEAVGVSLPGMERLVELGGDGTPVVAEFAAAELGAVLAMSPYGAGQLIGDALDLRHRLPRLWARVLAGQVRPWVARKTAQATRPLSLDAALLVDTKVAPWAHSLSWGRLEHVVVAAIIVADPAAAVIAAEEAAQARGVWVGRSSDHGVKDIFIRTDAPAAIWFDAAIDRIADGLGLLGDPSSQQTRRAEAVGVIAHPQQALDLYDQAATIAGPDPNDPATDDTDNDDSEPCADTDAGAVVVAGTSPPGRRRLVASRPPAVLYVHVGAEALTRDRAGVARFEGVGPISTDQATRFLRHCHVTVRPVIDLPTMAPVDAYEVPDRLREAVHLRSPVDTFPYATNTSRGKDIDHTEAYRDPDLGGPPDQTRLDNLAPMTRFHHRIKTHSRWHVTQASNGVLIWTSPHHRHYLVDNTGTHTLNQVE